MSQESTLSGFEIEVAGLLAADLGRSLDIVWIPQRDHGYFRQTIGSGGCDAIMGVPADFGRLTTTRVWYRTGFVFMTRAADPVPKSFDDPMLRESLIGVPATGLGDTPPVLALTRRSLADNLRPFSVYESDDMVAAVDNHTLDVAVLWGPFAGWLAAELPSLVITATPDTDRQIPFTFDIAIGVRKGDLVLRDQLDLALQRQQPHIADILKRWNVPLRAVPARDP
jgi:mxaJ protein